MSPFSVSFTARHAALLLEVWRLRPRSRSGRFPRGTAEMPIFLSFNSKDVALAEAVRIGLSKFEPTLQIFFSRRFRRQKARRVTGLGVDDQFKFDRQLNQQVGRFCTTPACRNRSAPSGP
jgi:hypothetical protein